MAAATITVELLKGSIPAACYQVGGRVSAAVVQIDGLTVLPLEIETITVGAGDTDEVEFSYDDSYVPDGATLLACNLSSFQCVCDCCPERSCYEVVPPSEEVLDATSYHVGFIPSEIIIDQIKIFSPGNSPDPITINLVFSGVALLLGVEVPYSGFVINRAAFDPAFADGLIAAHSQVTLEVTNVSGDPWFGLSVCFLGFRQSIFAP